ncbi:hypothetical protein BDW75DRAFT_198287 [Aspergillus navahoensis]
MHTLHSVTSPLANGVRARPLLSGYGVFNCFFFWDRAAADSRSRRLGKSPGATTNYRRSFGRRMAGPADITM